MSNDSTSSPQRYTRDQPCPICGGGNDDPRGQGVRCTGFQSGDYARCSREEHAGGLPIDNKSATATYVHFLRGACRCGRTHGIAAASREPSKPQGASKLKKRDPGFWARVVESYVYEDAAGNPVMKVDRMRDPKEFFQYRPNGTFADGRLRWKAGTRGIALVPFRLPDLLAAGERIVWVVEGEKDVNRFRTLGLVATCGPRGAENAGLKAIPELAPYFRGLHVRIIPDNDKPGRTWAELFAWNVRDLAASLKIIPLPGLAEKGDGSDWLDAGNTAEDLLAIESTAPPWIPPADAPGGSAPTEPGNGSTAGPNVDNPPKIILGTDMHRVVDEAVACLARSEDIFARGPFLVRVLPWVGRRKRRDPERVEGTPQVVRIELATLTEMLCGLGKWVAVADKRGVLEEKGTTPPKPIVAAVNARMAWPSVRQLEGVIEAPTVRMDGSVIDTPGWDEDTGLLYQPNTEFPPVPALPTQEDAKAAAKELLQLVYDFPFIDESHRSAWLAGLLTVMARAIIDGPVPFFVINSNMRGVGKSYLVHLIAILASGRLAACQPYPKDDEEMRKVLLSLAVCADSLVLFDNIETGTRIGLPSLDAALSSRNIRGRLLGSNENVVLPWLATCFATGNNLATKSDMIRRVIPVGLQTTEMNPEERRDFTIKGNLLDHAQRERPRLVRAALTILKGHALAGRPTEAALAPLGGFEAWCNIVRSAVVWATGADPCGTRIGLSDDDQDTAAAESIAKGWAELCIAEGKDALSIASGLKALGLALDTEHGTLRAVLDEMAFNGKPATVRIIGNKFGKYRGRPTKAGILQRKLLDGVNSWFVTAAKAPPKLPSHPISEVDQVYQVDRVSPYAGEKEGTSQITEYFVNIPGGESRSTSSTRSTSPEKHAFADSGSSASAAPSANGHAACGREVFEL
jgi:hypothetical protein